MALIADILMIAGALGVGFYCFVLSRRLSRFTNLEKGMGGAIAVLSAQVDNLTRSLEAAQAAASGSGESLKELTVRAEDLARRLELQVAALHDLDPDAVATSESDPAQPVPEPEQTESTMPLAASEDVGDLDRTDDAGAAPGQVRRSIFSTQRRPQQEAGG
ncbi:hypothetical protein [Tranquillimonas rosea]|uniref:hypothetical protein n=1 Tax=Tranquillimonas rosea TaxID=641238 RepID=UPI003BA9F2B9